MEKARKVAGCGKSSYLLIRLAAAYTSHRMQLPDEAIDQFRTIYREEFGEDISWDEAADIGTRLVALIKLLRQSPPKRPPSADPPPLTSQRPQSRIE